MGLPCMTLVYTTHAQVDRHIRYKILKLPTCWQILTDNVGIMELLNKESY